MTAIASGDEPEEPASARATELLGVLLLVYAQCTGFLHLAYACMAGPLAANDSATELRNPAVYGRHLVPMVTAIALPFTQRSELNDMR